MTKQILKPMAKPLEKAETRAYKKHASIPACLHAKVKALATFRDDSINTLTEEWVKDGYCEAIQKLTPAEFRVLEAIEQAQSQGQELMERAIALKHQAQTRVAA